MDIYSINNKNILSPITKLPSKIVEELEAKKIIDLYLSDLGIDVRKYFKDIDKLYICECNQTKYRFYYPDSIVGDKFFYESLQKYNWYYPKWKWENEKSISYLNINDKILDVGCGNGQYLFGLKELGYNNLNAIDTGIFNEGEFKNRGIVFHNMNIEEFSKENSEVFDVITCFQLLEHIGDVNSFVNSCIKLLKKRGKLIIGVPNNNPYLYKHDLYHILNLPPHHQGIWNKEALTNIEKIYSLKILKIKIEPINEHIGAYSRVQMDYLTRKSPYIDKLLKVKLFFRMYTKILFLFKDCIEGRNIVAVYQKLDNK